MRPNLDRFEFLQGWYLYKGGKGKGGKPLNEQAIEILKKYALEPKLPITDEDIQQRLSFRFVNEAVLCLEEGVLVSPDLRLVWKDTSKN